MRGRARWLGSISTSPDPSAVEALVFDVFGTLVDWRGSLIDDLTAFGTGRGIVADWPALVDRWRGMYVPSMDRVRRGERPWTSLDTLHRESFDTLAEEFGFASALDEQARRWCVGRWHRLAPWPDTVGGLMRLRTGFILGTLSNGNVRLLTDLAKNAALPMDVIFSAELFRHYKPDAEVYRGAVALLDARPEQVMLVAAHPADLAAAANTGMRTALVARPLEYGTGNAPEIPATPGFDLAVSDLNDLAERLGV